jgi:hypothetical protein
MDQQIAIDNIKRLMNMDNQQSQQIELQAGDGIGIARFMNGYSISAIQNEQDPLTQRRYTIQICVDGEQKSLDVFVAGDPY